MKSLYLLSFSLTFLSQGIANDFSYEEQSEQVGNEEYVADYDAEDQLLDEEQAYEPLSSQSQDWLSDAQQPDNSTSSQSSSNQSQDCLSPYHRMHVSARHNESKGIGYHDGYTTIEAFGIYDGWSSHFMPFLDLRGHVFNNGKLAGNVGIGERTLISSWSHTFGSYLYYDVRRVGHGLTVNQLSPGLELVGRRMEYRINGYFPLGKDKTRKYHYQFDEFEGHNIILKSRQQRALRGGDAEVGVHVTQSTKYDLYAAAGPYYLHAPHAHSWGGRTRLVGRYKEYVSLEVAYSYDNLFRSIVQGSVALTVPFGKKLRRTGQGCPQGNDLLLSRASFAPSRFEIPVVKRVRRKEKAINPATGKPWTVWFVNNTSHSAGTFESPFPTLLQAQNASAPNDMIYVFPGDGTTTGMNTGITLKDGQSFFGSGINQRFSTTKGTMTISKFSANYPSITNISGNGVTLGNGNVVSGFNIAVVGTNSGISSPVSAINGGTIANNIITSVGTANNGIVIGGFGLFRIYNNEVIQLQTTGVPSGIFLASTGGVMTAKVKNNSIYGFGNGVNLGLDNCKVQGNTIINATGEGVNCNLTKNNNLKITGNVIQTNVIGAGGIFIQDGPATLTGNIVIKNNQMDLGPVYFNAITVLSTFPNGWNMTVDVSNNSGTGVVAGAGIVTLLTAANNTMCLTLDNNNFPNKTSIPAYFLSASSTGPINIDSMEGNVGGPVNISGPVVNLVPKGTCGN